MDMKTIKTLKTIVFDFDGTLIDSQKMKLEAFYQLFPPDQCHQKIVMDVLSEVPEESRYVILASILNRMNFNTDHLEAKVQQLARDYDHIVVQGAINCREKPGATSLLQSAFNNYHLYINSNTPKDSLLIIVKHRGWLDYFTGIYGYPYGKEASLREIIKLEQVNPCEVIVVGDGKSDQLSAENVGCNFFAIHCDNALFELSKKLNLCG